MRRYDVSYRIWHAQPWYDIYAEAFVPPEIPEAGTTNGWVRASSANEAAAIVVGRLRTHFGADIAARATITGVVGDGF
jgi:hypothetical protein